MVIFMPMLFASLARDVLVPFRVLLGDELVPFRLFVADELAPFRLFVADELVPFRLSSSGCTCVVSPVLGEELVPFRLLVADELGPFRLSLSGLEICRFACASGTRGRNSSAILRRYQAVILLYRCRIYIYMHATLVSRTREPL